MDQNLKTLNPVNMSLTAHTHQNFNPPIESGGGGAVNFWPQLPICNQQSTNVSHVEYPSFKKPRISQTMNSRMPVLVNKPILDIPFKTELCLQFKRGHCFYGDNCHLAHGIGDTRRIQPHGQELMTKESNVARNWNEDHRIITTMRLCRRFCNGEECPYGERCHFLHERPAKFRKSFAISIGTTGPGGFSRNGCHQLECKTSVHSSLNANRASHKPVFWKTRLCNKWEATGNCPFGVNCYFAHGHAELHKFGSQSAMEQGNVSTSTILPIAATHASLHRTGNGTACEQQLKAKKCFFKWKGLAKISRIYADWIDDMPLVHSSLGKVAS